MLNETFSVIFKHRAARAVGYKNWGYKMHFTVFYICNQQIVAQICGQWTKIAKNISILNVRIFDIALLRIAKYFFC